jgi:hypothetical protein
VGTVSRSPRAPSGISRDEEKEEKEKEKEKEGRSL